MMKHGEFVTLPFQHQSALRFLFLFLPFLPFLRNLRMHHDKIIELRPLQSNIKSHVQIAPER